MDSGDETSNGWASPTAEFQLDSVAQQTTSRQKKRRIATVYDAVAGRLQSTQEALKNVGEASSTSTGQNGGSRQRLRNTVLAPEEVLFRRRAAPVRYAEKDIYFANEDLPGGGRDVLPESDLLKAVHGYSSRFYGALAQRYGPSVIPGAGDLGNTRPGAHEKDAATWNIDESSMDETALLAFGIILEEASREVLGRHGDLVFTEGMVDEAVRDEDHAAGEHDARPGSRNGGAPTTVGFEDRREFREREMRKRRKLAETDDG